MRTQLATIPIGIAATRVARPTGLGAPVGLGAADLTDATLQAAAQALYQALQARGCINGYDALVGPFQQAYINAGGVLPNDTGGRSPVDNLYGTNTATALQLIYPDAPAGCVGAAPSGGGGGGSASTGLAPTATNAGILAGLPTNLNAYFADVMSGGPSLWWTVGAVGVVAVAAWAEKHEKHKKRSKAARKGQRRPKRRPASRRGRKGRKSGRGRRRGRR